MKKMIATLLAVSTAVSLGVSTFANEASINDQIDNSVSEIPAESMTESSSATESSSTESSSETESSNDSSSEVISSSSSQESSSSTVEDTVKAEPSAIVIKPDANGVVLGDTLLDPDTEYKFPVALIAGDKEVPMSEEYEKDFKFTYSKTSSNGVSTFKIEEYKGEYFLFVKTKATSSLKPIDVKYNIKMVRKSNNLPIFTQEVKFSYGYEEGNDDYINSLDKGDIVEIDNSRPVITAEQFDKIAEINDYKNVTLSGSGWQFTVNVTDESSKNLSFSNAGIKEVLAKFPNQDFKFFRFSGKPSFASTGRVALDISDIIDEFDSIYTYRYADGKLYRINATIDGEENTLNFRTNKLDTFVVTDKEIADGTVVTESTGSTEDNTQNSNGTSDDKNNPTTGASDMINAAVMAAIAAMTAGGAIALKKASK